MRKVIEQALLDLGAHRIEQTHFAPSGKTVAAMIREKIASSRAVIHLVGEFYGLRINLRSRRGSTTPTRRGAAATRSSNTTSRWS